MGWAWQTFSMELRKAMSYRFNFWMSFIGGVLAEMGVAYFLWRAVFDSQGAEQIAGFSFPAMMLYYFLIPVLGRISSSQDMGFLSQEIYDGSLTRYLVYPVPYFAYKYIGYLARSLIATFQCALALGIFLWLFGVPSDVALSPGSVLMGWGAAIASSALYFFMGAILEMVAFWMESVWSLMVMLRFIILFFGGGLVPLVFFPEWLQRASAVLPFQYLVSFPIRTLLGKVGAAEWFAGMGMLFAWTLLFIGLSLLVWRKGSRNYTAVGI